MKDFAIDGLQRETDYLNDNVAKRLTCVQYRSTTVRKCFVL